MKKTLIVFLALLLAVLPMFALATDSKEHTDIPVTVVKNVEPEDETKEVVPPVVEIVPDTPEIIEIQEDVKTLFRLTIFYVYVDGRTAAPTYDATLQGGNVHSIDSPVIKDYTASVRNVSGVMPMRDVQYTVVYFSPETEAPVFPYSEMPELFNLVDYEAARGLGFTVSNVGICFE